MFTSGDQEVCLSSLMFKAKTVCLAVHHKSYNVRWYNYFLKLIYTYIFLQRFGMIVHQRCWKVFTFDSETRGIKRAHRSPVLY